MAKELTIPIRNKRTGEVKQIPVSEASKYGIKLNPLQKFVGSKNAPLIGSAITGGVGGLISGGLGAIPAAALGGGATYALQDLLRPFSGLTETRTPGEKLLGAGEQAVKGAAYETLGQGIGYVGGKIASPLIRRLPFGKGAAVKEIGVIKGEVGSQIDELLKPFENKPLTQETVSSMASKLDKLAASQSFKHNPQAIEFIQTTKNMLLDDLTAGAAHGMRVDFGPQVFARSGAEKYAGTAAKKAAQATKQIVAPELKAGIEQVAPGYSDLINQYANLSKVQRGIESNIRITPASVASLLTGVPFGYGAGAAVGSGTLIATNPYLQFLLRKGIGQPLANLGRTIPYAGGIANNYLNP